MSEDMPQKMSEDMPCESEISSDMCFSGVGLGCSSEWRPVQCAASAIAFFSLELCSSGSWAKGRGFEMPLGQMILAIYMGILLYTVVESPFACQIDCQKDMPERMSEYIDGK